MQQLIAMTRKEFLLWAQKPGNWIIIFVIPLIFIWIMYAVFGGNSGTPVITIYAVNEDNSEAARRIMDALRDADNLVIEELETRRDADRRVGAGDRMAALVVPQGFANSITTEKGGRVEIIIDPARSEQANIVVGLVNAAIAPIIVDAEVSRSVERGVAQILETLGPTPTPEGTPADPAMLVTPTPQPSPTIELSPTPAGLFEEGDTGDEVIDPTPTPIDLSGIDSETLRTFLTSALKGVVSSQVQDAMDNPQVQLHVEPFEAQEEVRKPSLLDYLVPGYSLMFVFFLISSLAMTVIEEREMGTLRRLLVAPVARSRILLGKLLPYFLIAVVQFIAILLASSYIFNIDLGDAPLGLVMIIISSAAVMAGMGILIAALAKTAAQADGITTVVVLAMAVVSGAMFPSISIPGLQFVTPHYWAMQGFLNIIARGQGIAGALLPSGILMSMAVIFFTIGAIKFRFE